MVKKPVHQALDNMKRHYATISETGKRRNNEDAFRMANIDDSDRWLAVVCDGMGGHVMGEVASETVSNAIVEFWKKHTNEADSKKGGKGLPASLCGVR